MDEFYSWCDLYQVQWWQMPITWLTVIVGLSVVIIWWGYRWWSCRQKEISALSVLSPRERALMELTRLLKECETIAPDAGYDRLMKVIKEYYALTMCTDSECTRYLDTSIRDLCARAETVRFAVKEVNSTVLYNDICRIRAIIQDN